MDEVLSSQDKTAKPVRSDLALTAAGQPYAMQYNVECIRCDVATACPTF